LLVFSPLASHTHTLHRHLFSYCQTFSVPLFPLCLSSKRAASSLSGLLSFADSRLHVSEYFASFFLRLHAI
jgi:hypothetical protein